MWILGRSKYVGYCFGVRAPVREFWEPVLLYCITNSCTVMCSFYHKAPTPTPNVLCSTPKMHYKKNWYKLSTNWYPKQEPTFCTVINNTRLKIKPGSLALLIFNIIFSVKMCVIERLLVARRATYVVDVRFFGHFFWQGVGTVCIHVSHVHTVINVHGHMQGGDDWTEHRKTPKFRKSLNCNKGGREHW